MKDSVIKQRIEQLRKVMREHEVDVYLVVSDDFHASEYVGDYFKCREYLTGFDGSAGTVVVTEKEAGLWTDGRYFLQAEEQLKGTGITLYKMREKGVPTVEEYIEQVLEKDNCLAYDGRTVSVKQAERLSAICGRKQAKQQMEHDLVGEIWSDRPCMSAEPVWELEERYAGVLREDKLRMVRQEMEKQGADRYLLASLDDIAWLYNLRGSDILYNPVFLSYTIVEENRAILYADPAAVSKNVRQALEKDSVIVKPYFQVYQDLSLMDGHVKLMYDERTTNAALLQKIPKEVTCISVTNPTQKKAVKNNTEMANVREAHIKDGVAVTKLLYWLDRVRETKDFHAGRITELTVAGKLEAFRREQAGYLYQSFAPIIATGEHGAIIHYEPAETTDRPVETDTFLLMDVGGQYLEGTTDITRTVAMGELSYEQKHDYTTVLRGHLNLGGAVFPYGTAGLNLDVLAREPLWEQGLDFKHGTGHGVGYLLNVHEGPNGFRQREENGRGAVLEEGMITSDEPGLYFAGKYGIRLENLILCKKWKETDFGTYMRFEYLTMVPFDRRAILPEEMTSREIAMLNEYHKNVYENLKDRLSHEERQWLYRATREL